MDRALWKAKRILGEAWHKGFYYQRIETQYHLLGTDADDKVFHYIQELQHEDNYPDGLHEIDLSTLCQCTGLKDKNGTLIFEGDVVTYNAHNSPLDKEPKYVESPVYLHKLRNSYAVDYSEFANDDLWRYVSQGENVVEVTGNIHDKGEDNEKN